MTSRKYTLVRQCHSAVIVCKRNILLHGRGQRKVVICNLRSRARVLEPNIVRSNSAQRGPSKTRKEFQAELTACTHHYINLNPTYRYVLLLLCFLVL
jgi:hypothetical protein